MPERDRSSRRARLDQPQEFRRRSFLASPNLSQERFGAWSESFARFMGTAQFLIWMTIFVIAWLAWNTFAPPPLQWDPRDLNYTLLTLLLSLQASYAAPLILLAQNRQADRDRVALEQDRARDERNLADTEFLTREVAALRIALRESATRDFVRSELRQLLEDLEERGMTGPAPEEAADGIPVRKKKPKAERRPPQQPQPALPQSPPSPQT